MDIMELAAESTRGRIRMGWTVMSGVIVAACLIAAGAARAHHSVPAFYDVGTAFTRTGVVTEVEWVNPHARVFLQADDDAGNRITWEVRGHSPTSLERNGWKRDETLKIGDIITVNGWRARDGSPVAYVSRITLPDGRTMTFGAAVGVTGVTSAAP